MTEIGFHFNAPDKLAYACRLLRKATAGGARVVVVAPGPALELLDRGLWSLSPTDFVAHCRATDPAPMLRASPILLTEAADAAPHHQVLLNLGGDVPQGFGRFERLIEVVSLGDEADRKGARARWKHYADRGYAITRHDLALKA